MDMGVSADATPQPRLARDHKFHPLRVRDVVQETADTCSLVLELPEKLVDAFAYKAGQFVTFRVTVDGEQQLRSYSMSSSPDVDDRFCVTVKRVPGGVVSNWINDNVKPGDVLDTTCPAGHFCLGPDERDVVAFAGGSGITPVISIIKTVLATTGRNARLLYANRDRDAVIFDKELGELDQRYPGRLDVLHHLDVDSGFVNAETLRAYVDAIGDAEYFICGPGPFMNLVEDSLLGGGVDAERIHIERFTPRETPEEPAETEVVAEPGAAKTMVTIELNGKTETTDHRPGTTLLQAARQAGLKPPSSCEAGDCATCMAKLVEGTAKMFVNNALTDDEVEEGWVLTCQAVPDPPSVHVVYDYD